VHLRRSRAGSHALRFCSNRRAGGNQWIGRILAYVTGMVDQEQLTRIEYLAPENPIPSGHAGNEIRAGHQRQNARILGLDAIGAKRTCRGRGERVDVTKMTHLRHWLCTAAAILMPGLRPITGEESIGRMGL
jgi:hypothetical protein